MGLFSLELKSSLRLFRFEKVQHRKKEQYIIFVNSVFLTHYLYPFFLVTIPLIKAQRTSFIQLPSIRSLHFCFPGIFILIVYDSFVQHTILSTIEMYSYKQIINFLLCALISPAIKH